MSFAHEHAELENFIIRIYKALRRAHCTHNLIVLLYF